MVNCFLFINSFLNYMLLLIIMAVLIIAGVLVGRKMRINKEKKDAAVKESKIEDRESV